MEARQEWLIDQCKGGYIKHIQETVDAVHLNNIFYERMGVTGQWSAATPHDQDSAECAQQDAMAGHIGDMG